MPPGDSRTSSARRDDTRRCASACGNASRTKVRATKRKEWSSIGGSSPPPTGIASTAPRWRISVLRRAIALLLLAGCTTLKSTSGVRPPMLTLELQHAVWAIDIEDESGRVLYEHNAHTLVVP